MKLLDLTNIHYIGITIAHGSFKNPWSARFTLWKMRMPTHVSDQIEEQLMMS